MVAGILLVALGEKKSDVRYKVGVYEEEEMELENEKISVLIADDHGMILDILSLYLSAQTDIFVKTAADVDTAADLLKSDG
ncbi:MAG: hypothetical protein P8M25_13925, partial [Paracoccaceae bacterium]|nr:hypothetical protein [Paracoccaceae bacterium]